MPEPLSFGEPAVDDWFAEAYAEHNRLMADFDKQELLNMSAALDEKMTEKMTEEEHQALLDRFTRRVAELERETSIAKRRAKRFVRRMQQGPPKEQGPPKAWRRHRGPQRLDARVVLVRARPRERRSRCVARTVGSRGDPDPEPLSPARPALKAAA